MLARALAVAAVVSAFLTACALPPPSVPEESWCTRSGQTWKPGPRLCVGPSGP